jgi:hypothetical protein
MERRNAEEDKEVWQKLIRDGEKGRAEETKEEKRKSSKKIR